MISAVCIRQSIRFTWLLPGLMLILLANPATADEYQLENGGFYGYYNPPLPLPQLYDWEHYSYSDRGAAWSALDIDDQPDSGSAAMHFSFEGNGGTGMVLYQCVKRDPNASHVHYGASALVDEEESNGVGAHIKVRMFKNDDCTGTSSLGGEGDINWGSNEWRGVSNSFALNSETQSIKISLGIRKLPNAGSDGLVHFDNVWLEQEVLPLFDDRFEK